jgi:hypothetical protein
MTSSRQGYSVRRKNLDAELVWGFGEDLAGVAAPAGPSFSSVIALLVIVVGKRRTLIAEPGAEDFGHVPERFVEPEIFIDAFDSPTLGHPASVGSAARVVALTATDKVMWVVMSCIGSEGSCEHPRFWRRDLRGFFGSGFLGLFDLLLGSDFGAVLLATVLSELPVLGSQEVLGMLLTIFGFPIVSAQLTFDDDLLALLSEGSEVFG